MRKSALMEIKRDWVEVAYEEDEDLQTAKPRVAHSLQAPKTRRRKETRDQPVSFGQVLAKTGTNTRPDQTNGNQGSYAETKTCLEEKSCPTRTTFNGKATQHASC